MLYIMNLMLLLVAQSGNAGETGYYKDEKNADYSESVIVCSRPRMDPTKHFLMALENMYRAGDDTQFKQWASTTRYIIETCPSVLNITTPHALVINGKPSSLVCSVLQAAVFKRNSTILAFLATAEVDMRSELDDEDSSNGRFLEALYTAVDSYFFDGVSILVAYGAPVKGDTQVLQQLVTGCNLKKLKYNNLKRLCCGNRFDTSYEVAAYNIAKLLVQYGANARFATNLIAQSQSDGVACTGAGCSYLASLVTGQSKHIRYATAPTSGSSCAQFSSTSSSSLELSPTPSSPFSKSSPSSPTLPIETSVSHIINTSVISKSIR